MSYVGMGVAFWCRAVCLKLEIGTVAAHIQNS